MASHKPLNQATGHAGRRAVAPASHSAVRRPSKAAKQAVTVDSPAARRHIRVQQEAIDTSAIRPSRGSRRAHLQTISLRRSRVIMASPLRGSMESLVRQNEKTEADGLERILDDNDLRDRIAHGQLVPVPISNSLGINANLPEDRRYCRPWTATFLTDLAQAHARQFHRSLEVSSAVRTVEYQKQLMRINGNAAAAEGDIASPHLTGGTIDIAKQGMNRQELAWMRSWLLATQDAGKIDVEEEFKQSCFHITVYKSYAPPLPDTSSTPEQPWTNPTLLNSSQVL